MKRKTINPDLENSINIASPAIDAMSEYDIDFKPVFNKVTFREFKGEVFILSGRYDHVADYRSSIYLAGLLRRATLFIFDDDHTFKRLKSSNDYSILIQDFFCQIN